MNVPQVFDRGQLLKLAAWSRMMPDKTAFVDPSGGGMPPAAAPPMDPAMSGAMPPGAAPVDPMMMAVPPGAPPPAPAPADPVQTMGDQEMMRQMIRDEVQKAVGGGEGGVAAPGQKKGNKIEELYQMLEMMREQNKEDKKIFVAALRNAGIEIPLGDILAIENNRGDGLPTVPGLGQAPTQPGTSETMNSGLGGDAAGGQAGKVAAQDDMFAQLTKLAQTKDRLKRSALASKLSPACDPQEADLSYLAGLYR